MASFQKCWFQRLDANLKPTGEKLYAQFNPTELGFDKQVQLAEVAIPGLDSPLVQFVRLAGEKISLELFFDTTDTGMDDNAKSVTILTDPFYELLKIDSDGHAPPRIQFGWGQEFPGGRISDMKQGRHTFRCVIDNVKQTFTLFSPTGTPLRAKLTLGLREYKTLEEQVAQLNLQSPDVTKAYVVQTGDTLPKIAYIAYSDPKKWRDIATANDIADPTLLEPGSVLSIPSVT